MWALVVAGGSGARFGAYKQFALLGGREVAEWSLATARQVCDGTVLVVPPDLTELYRGRATRVAAGGPTRPASVRAGLSALPPEAEVVAVQDAARPLASRRLWAAVIAAIEQGADGAVPCVAVTDTIKQRGADGRLLTLDRSLLLAAQTPQAFLVKALRAAHLGEPEATDDAGLVEAAGGQVVEVPGEPDNLKITRPADLVVAEALLKRRGRLEATGRQGPAEQDEHHRRAIST